MSNLILVVNEAPVRRNMDSVWRCGVPISQGGTGKMKLYNYDKLA